MKDAEVLGNASLFAVFDVDDQLVCVCVDYESLDQQLVERTSKLADGQLERLKLGRVNCSADKLASLLSGGSKMSGREGMDTVLVAGSGWFIKASPHAWAHKIPPICTQDVKAVVVDAVDKA